MLRILTFNALDDVTSAFLNSLQDDVSGVLPSADLIGGNAYDPSCAGTQGLILQTVTVTPLANDEPVLIDAFGTSGIDWRDRVLLDGVCVFPSGVQLVGNAQDPVLNAQTGSPYTTRVQGKYTGTGAYSSTATANAVTPGIPPVNGVGAVLSYSIALSHHLGALGGPFLYADPTDGSLYIYQVSGGVMPIILALVFSAQTGRR